MRYHFKINQEDSGYRAECLELKNCMTQGDTIQELLSNAKEALDLFLEEPAESDFYHPLPNPDFDNTEHIVAVQADPQIALANYIKYMRAKKGLTQKEAAKLFGFKHLYSYQRLESTKGDPKFSTLAKVKKVFPEIDIDKILC
jgi:antitoxin HicB